MIDKLTKPFKYRLMMCRHCGQRLRFPRQNKAIRITCPKCHTQYDIRVENPFGIVFQFNRNQSIVQNLKGMITRFKGLQGQTKWSLTLFFVSLGFLIFFVVASIVHPPSTSQPRPGPEPPNQELTI